MRAPVSPEILQEIREALQRQERTQAWLARKTLASRTAVNYYLSGFHRPTEEWLRQALSLLGLTKEAGHASAARGPPAA